MYKSDRSNQIMVSGRISTLSNMTWLALIISVLFLNVACSDKERRRVKNAFDDIHDFHVKSFTAAAKTGAAVHEYLADAPSTKKTEIVYVHAPEKVQEQDDKNRIKDFIAGYYANNERAIFTFDVMVKSFAINELDKISLKWSVVTNLTDDGHLQTCIREERNRLGTALSERGYYYPPGISVTVDVTRGDGSQSQIWGVIRW
jgi:hypothetical protein